MASGRVPMNERTEITAVGGLAEPRGEYSLYLALSTGDRADSFRARLPECEERDNGVQFAPVTGGRPSNVLSWRRPAVELSWT
jgi:hypothetical protein